MPVFSSTCLLFLSSLNILKEVFNFCLSLPRWLRGLSVCLQCGRPGFNPWVRKIPWRRKWQPTPVLLPGESHGWRSLVGYSPCVHCTGRHVLNHWATREVTSISIDQGNQKPLSVTVRVSFVGIQSKTYVRLM